MSILGIYTAYSYRNLQPARTDAGIVPWVFPIGSTHVPLVFPTFVASFGLVPHRDCTCGMVRDHLRTAWETYAARVRNEWGTSANKPVADAPDVPHAF